MRPLLISVRCLLSLALIGQVFAADSPGDAVAGTYEILICKEADACSFADRKNVVVAGQVVLFANNLEKKDLDRFDENRFTYRRGEAINGCFTLEKLQKDAATFAGIETIGVTTWKNEATEVGFDLMRSTDAAYVAMVKRAGQPWEGRGLSVGGGIGPTSDKRVNDRVVMRRKGDASISNCSFQTAEEHEFRRLLADPARQKIDSIEKEYRQSLFATLQASTAPRDWAMAGWMQWPSTSESYEALILRARKAAPDDALIRWIAVDKVHAYDVPVTINGKVSGVTLRSRELDPAALAQLQRAEPDNAAPWLMALRDAVDGNDDAAADISISHLASSAYYDDHAVELLNAQLVLLRTHPLPDEFFAAVAKLDPGWRLHGDFTRHVAPYYGNSYPFAGMNSIYSPLSSYDAGMHELYVVCTQRPARSEARMEQCVQIARMLAARSRREVFREDGARLLSEIGRFDNADIERARAECWVVKQYNSIRSDRVDKDRPDVAEGTAFVNDWIAAGDEFEAMRRAAVRANKSLQPPADWELDRAQFGNFGKAREAPEQSR
jgi:hypothetical protein